MYFSIFLQYILELAKQLVVDPRACIGSFFERIQVADAEYKRHFDDEVASFKARITKRAAEKIEDALAEQEEEERKERLGPGGLDPVEVFESLPEVKSTQGFIEKCSTKIKTIFFLRSQSIAGVTKML